MVRTRFAPSPTGSLHIGGIRTALYCYALAKKQRGEFLLRIEDTDLQRYQKGSIEEIIEMLEAYHISPDRIPSTAQIAQRAERSFYGEDWLLHAEELKAVQDRNFNDIYLQTLRVPLYQKYALSLLEKGFAYLCFCSKERLVELRQSQQAAGSKPGYDGRCRRIGFDQAMIRVEKGEPCVVRLDVDAYKKWKDTEIITHDDRLMGRVVFPLTEVDSQVLIKSNGLPTYHLAVVVDDYLMQITHPMRAVEWISSTPKQVMIYQMLDWEVPRYTHLTLILDPTGGKLSKRKGSVAAKDFLAQGYLPEATLNYLMLLGWSSEDDREIFSLKEFVKEFSLETLNKSNAVFDRTKLEWLNGFYIRERLSDKQYNQYFYDFMLGETQELPGAQQKVKEVALLLRDRLKIFSEVPELTDFFFAEEVSVDRDKLIEQTGDAVKTREMLAISLACLEKLSVWKVGSIEPELRKVGSEKEWKNREFFMTIRIAVSGQTATPPLFDTLAVLGREKTLGRLDKALQTLTVD
ncbi:glutamate--tRNA ligase [Patescibacteria group bacterium]|nr:glutamate--tRNA ligase [Patescibacteria group bacterium]MBU1868484.1 glutamate--tRNA ligase [Patescibacteria group bacterium]